MRSRKVPFVSIAVVVVVRLSRRPCILMSEVRPLRLSSPRAGPSGIMVRYAERDTGFSNDMPETISKCYHARICLSGRFAFYPQRGISCLEIRLGDHPKRKI